MKNLTTAILILITLTACGGEKRIDCSTDKTMSDSLIAVQNSLNEPKKTQFEDAVKTITIKEIRDMNALKLRLNGKTADEVIAEAETIRAEIKAKREKAKQEMAKREAERKAEKEKKLVEWEARKVELEKRLEDRKTMLADVEAKLKKLDRKKDWKLWMEGDSIRRSIKGSIDSIKRDQRSHEMDKVWIR